MADTLSEWLDALPAPAFAELAATVLGSVPTTHGLARRALEQHLCDEAWIDQTLAKLGPRARTALATLSLAGVPVLRADALSLSGGPDVDPIEQLEAHGLITAVRSGPGMPTHVAVTPGLAEIIRTRTIGLPTATVAGAGPLLGGARRRFQLALVVATLVQHPPRLTRDGRPHAADLATLAHALAPLGLSPARLLRELSDLTELGLLAVDASRLHVVLPEATDIDASYLRLSFEELAAPSLPEETLAVVARLVASGSTLSMGGLLDAARGALLRDRAEASELHRKGARRELIETLSSTLGLQAVVLLDASGQPIAGAGDELLARVADGEELSIALDPAVTALLRGEPPPTARVLPGHVQSSFEIVADPSCAPSLIACVGAAAELVRADRAAVLRLTGTSVRRALEAGLAFEVLDAALAALSGRPVPSNVEHTLRDWARGHAGVAPRPPVPPTALEPLVVAARSALLPFHGTAA